MKLADEIRDAAKGLVPQSKLEEGYANAVEDLVQVIEEYERTHGWQPIETAPKDETSILVFAKHKLDSCSSVVQASWFEGQFYADSRECIIDFEDGLTCTHWMPLLHPPKQKIEESL